MEGRREDHHTTGEEAPLSRQSQQELEKSIALIHSELVMMRRGIEGLFDKFDEYQQPINYSTDISKLIKQVSEAEKRLAEIEKSPVLKKGAEHYGQILISSGSQIAQEAAEKLEHHALLLRQIASQFIERMASARQRKRQNGFLFGCGLTGVAVGMALVLLGPRFLPLGSDVQVASLILADTPVNSGVKMLQTDYPNIVASIVLGSLILDDNSAMLSSCRNIVLRTGKPQPCPIILTPEASRAF